MRVAAERHERARIEKKFEKKRKKFLTNGNRCANIYKFAASESLRERRLYLVN